MAVDVAEYAPERAGEWKAFLEASNNGTLFHDLDFLAYHPPGRFATRHLVFHQEGNLSALLPAAVVGKDGGRRVLKSPYGASVGGPVLPRAQSAEAALALVESLKGYAAASALDGVEITLGPSQYMREPDDHLAFSLLAGGFLLRKRWLCHMIALPTDPGRVPERFTRGKARDVRAGLRRGLRPFEAGPESLGEFYRLLLTTQAKHSASPTHRLDELEDLCRRVPGRVRLFMCAKADRPLAAVLVMVLNRVVAYTFYICQAEEGGEPLATTVLLAHVARVFAGEGFRFLDLGPTTFADLSLNCGLAFFKEGFGARGFCRDTWCWWQAAVEAEADFS